MRRERREVGIQHRGERGLAVRAHGELRGHRAPDLRHEFGDQRVAGREVDEDRAVRLARGPRDRGRARAGEAFGGDHAQAGLDQLAARRFALAGSSCGGRA